MGDAHGDAMCANGPSYLVLGHIAAAGSTGYASWLVSLVYAAWLTRQTSMILVEPCVRPDGTMHDGRARDEVGCQTASVYFNMSSLGVGSVPAPSLFGKLEHARGSRCRVGYVVPPAPSCKLDQRRRRNFLPDGAVETARDGYVLARTAAPSTEIEALQLASALREQAVSVIVLAAEWTSTLARVHWEPHALLRARWLRACEPRAPGQARRSGAYAARIPTAATDWLAPSEPIWSVVRSVQRDELRGRPYVAVCLTTLHMSAANVSTCADGLRALVARAVAASSALTREVNRGGDAPGGATKVVDVPIVVLTDPPLEWPERDGGGSGQALTRAAVDTLVAEAHDGFRGSGAWLHADALVRARLARNHRALSTELGVQLAEQLLAAQARLFVAHDSGDDDALSEASKSARADLAVCGQAQDGALQTPALVRLARRAMLQVGSHSAAAPIKWAI
mmetsp:Transcript_24287/g.62618  ORF Transcript_24287/g.62618 Transcript_24287/m.62618 type:complete len:452 (+) Transcript_24287:3-1358(+)